MLCQEDLAHSVEGIPMIMMTQYQSSRCSSNAYQDLRQAQCEDASIQPILQGKEEDNKPDREVKVKNYADYQMWDQLIVQNGILHRQFQSPDGTCRLQLVVPRKL